MTSAWHPGHTPPCGRQPSTSKARHERLLEKLHLHASCPRVARLRPILAIPPPRAAPFAFCELCGTGDGIVLCPHCDGSGEVVTKPGGAGVRFLIGLARCKTCNGQGRIPCMFCAGMEVRLPPPQPFRPAGPPFSDGDEEEAPEGGSSWNPEPPE